MSSCTIVGFFELRNRQPRSKDIKKLDGTTYKISHLHYNSDVICSKHMSLPAEIRQYMGTKEPILRENPAAFVVAKLCVPTGEGPTDLLLEAWHIAPVPGDPANDDYDVRLIDFEMPLVFALGTVETVPDGVSGGIITFLVTVTDFV